MFDTIESYKLDKENNRRKQDRRQYDNFVFKNKIDEFETKFNSFEDKMEDFEKKLDDFVVKINRISTGITNTIDSHRVELSDLNSRLNETEQIADKGTSQRNVLLMLITIMIALMITFSYNYFSFKKVEVKNNQQVNSILTELTAKDK